MHIACHEEEHYMETIFTETSAGFAPEQAQDLHLFWGKRRFWVMDLSITDSALSYSCLIGMCPLETQQDVQDCLSLNNGMTPA